MKEELLEQLTNGAHVNAALHYLGFVLNVFMIFLLIGLYLWKSFKE